MIYPLRTIWIRSRQKVVRDNAIGALIEQAQKQNLKDCIVFQLHRDKQEFLPQDSICLMTIEEIKEWKAYQLREKLKKSLV